jgi:hypothetical protein
VFRYVGQLLEGEQDLVGSRMRNQGDFYALVGAVDRLARRDSLPDANKAGPVLLAFADATAEGARRLTNGHGGTTKQPDRQRMTPDNVRYGSRYLRTSWATSSSSCGNAADHQGALRARRICASES